MRVQMLSDKTVTAQDVCGYYVLTGCNEVVETAIGLPDEKLP